MALIRLLAWWHTAWKVSIFGVFWSVFSRISVFFRIFPRIFWLNKEIYSVNLRIQPECGKIRTRKTPDTNMFYVVTLFLVMSTFLVWMIRSSNHMSGRAIWDKLPACIFENFDIARVKREQFQNSQKSGE